MEETKENNYKWLALLTVAIGTFMATLDLSIVNISFPRLTQVFATEASVVLWVTVSYLLVSVSLMLTFGRIGDVFGRKKVYVLGFGLFTVGLVLCSLSQTIAQLILSRIIQGIGAAMVVALGNAIVTASFPNQERGKALGMVGATVSAGLLTGPAIGGFLLDLLGWRGVFYTRVPIGIIGMVMGGILLKEQRSSTTGLKLDLGGAATLFGSLSCLLLFMNLGGRLGFTSPPVPVLAGGMLILLALFVVLEKRAAHGIVDLNLFKSRPFSGGNISLAIMYLAASVMTFLTPFYLIEGLGHSASGAGLLMAVVALAALLAAPPSGWLSDRVGPMALCTIGISLVCGALFMLSRLGTEATTANILPGLAILGIGQGMFQSPNNSSIMGSVPTERLSTASAMLATFRQIGMSTGTAIAGTIFTTRQLLYAAQFSSDNLNPLIAHKLSIVGGFRDTLLIAAIICSIGIFTSLARGKRHPGR